MHKILAAAALYLVAFSTTANAETTECTEITTIPTVITVQGVYCLKGDLATGDTSGKMIEIQTNNVIIDLNGYKLGGLAGGNFTNAIGIYANNRANITVKNGSIRGFLSGIELDGALGFGHRVENIKADGNRVIGINVDGDDAIIRNNHIINTGAGPGSNAYGIFVSGGKNLLISGNVVGTVYKSLTAYGILGISISTATISENYIYDVRLALQITGVAVFSSSDVMVENNRFINEETGTVAITDGGNSTDIGCIDNKVHGYTTASSGCDYSSGNHVY